MASNIADMASQMESFIYNPASIQRVALQTFSDVSNGALVIFDPSNPLVALLESGAAMVAAYASKDQVNLRQTYAKLSQTQTDLYGHMSDTDYLDLFATPAAATFIMMFNQTDLLAAMVADDELGYSYIEIPANSYFTVADTVFSLQYPIEIRLLQHGGLQVVLELDPVGIRYRYRWYDLSEVRHRRNSGECVEYHTGVECFGTRPVPGQPDRQLLLHPRLVHGQ
jgi:hypothetical protein